MLVVVVGNSWWWLLVAGAGVCLLTPPHRRKKNVNAHIRRYKFNIQKLRMDTNELSDKMNMLMDIIR